jgi:hypothetical protein
MHGDKQQWSERQAGRLCANSIFTRGIRLRSIACPSIAENLPIFEHSYHKDYLVLLNGGVQEGAGDFRVCALRHLLKAIATSRRSSAYLR